MTDTDQGPKTSQETAQAGKRAVLEVMTREMARLEEIQLIMPKMIDAGDIEGATQYALGHLMSSAKLIARAVAVLASPCCQGCAEADDG